MIRLTQLGAVIAVLFLLTAPVSAQTVGGWELVGVQHLADFIEGDHSFRNATLSPDGSAIAWEGEDGEICVYTFADETTTCHARPDDGRFSTGRYNLMAWSPDSAQLGLYEDLFMRALESDLWIFELASGTITNRTDDGFYGGFFRAEPEDNVTLDLLPTWNPATGELYFFRSVERHALLTDDTYLTTELYRLPPEGDAEQVYDMTSAFTEPLTIYRPAVFSPDGTKLAFLSLPRDVMTNPTAGVWVFDLETETLEQVATMDDLRGGLPEWDENPLVPESLAWSGNEHLVVSSAGFPQYGTILFNNAYFISLADSTVTPLFDFSAVENERDVLDGEGEDVLFALPRLGAVSPDGSAYWYLNYNAMTHESGFSALPLPPAGEAPTLLGDAGYVPSPGQDAAPTVSEDGKALFFDMLLTFEHE